MWPTVFFAGWPNTCGYRYVNRKWKMLPCRYLRLSSRFVLKPPAILVSGTYFCKMSVAAFAWIGNMRLISQAYFWRHRFPCNKQTISFIFMGTTSFNTSDKSLDITQPNVCGRYQLSKYGSIGFAVCIPKLAVAFKCITLPHAKILFKAFFGIRRNVNVAGEGQ